ncbi:MAG: hypothetical protein ACKVY0_05360 [Prosthecobacter sp.]|uniref:hypothetical protein n=1 Tax=Prosthecobacter sp. TaxID=1965333 RepID=UPI0039010FA2
MSMLLPSVQFLVLNPAASAARKPAEMMNHALLEALPRPLRAAVESAGYRVVRWAAAREVLQTRVTKGRITGAVGEFLARWLPVVPVTAIADEWMLTFAVMPKQIRLAGGSESLAASPLEHALLHLPALRSFWRNELRQQHFVALKALVPPVWLMDSAPVPPGAVIHGLGITAWDQLERVNGHEWDMRDQVLTARAPSGLIINAGYGRNDQGQIVLRSVEAMP